LLACIVLAQGPQSYLGSSWYDPFVNFSLSPLSPCPLLPAFWCACPRSRLCVPRYDVSLPPSYCVGMYCNCREETLEDIKIFQEWLRESHETQTLSQRCMCVCMRVSRYKSLYESERAYHRRPHHPPPPPTPTLQNTSRFVGGGAGCLQLSSLSYSTLLHLSQGACACVFCVCVGGVGVGGGGGGVLALSLASRIFWTHACFAYIIILLYKYPPPHYLITGLEDLLASHSLFSGFCDGLYNMCGFGCVYVCASYVYTLHLCLVCVCVCGPPHMTHVSSSSYDASSRGILELDHSVTRTHTFTCAYTCRRRER